MIDPEVGDIVQYKSHQASDGYGIIVSLRPYKGNRDNANESHWCGVRFILPPHDWPGKYSVKQHCDIECTNVWLTKIGRADD